MLPQAASETELARSADLDAWVADNFQSMTRDEQLTCEQLLLNLGTILKDWVHTAASNSSLPRGCR